MTKVGWRPWLVLFAFSLLSALITVAIYTALGIALPLMVKDLKWNWTEAGFGFTVIGGCIGASSYLPALLIRRIGVRSTLLLGTLLVAAGLLSLSATHGLTFYFLGAALCGVGYQMMALIPATHVLGALFRRRSAAFGIYFTLSSAMAAGGPLMVIGLLQLFHGDWRLLWLIEVAVALVIGAGCALAMGGPGWLALASARTDEAFAEDRAKPVVVRSAHGVQRTQEDWTLKAALKTPQFYILLAAYFGHVLCLATTASFAFQHLTEHGVSTLVIGGVLTIEALMGMVWRLLAGVLGDIVNPRYVLIFSVGALVLGMFALAAPQGYLGLLVFAVGVGIGTTVTALAVTVLLLDYFGRKHNLEIFSTVCMVGALSALGPTLGGVLRDHLGSFTPTFQLFAALNGAVFIAAVLMRPPSPRTVGLAAPDRDASPLERPTAAAERQPVPQLANDIA